MHLRVHSAYSLLEGALPLSKIVAQAAKDSAPAIAVTDTNNLFGALEFAQKAAKEGVQPIIGCQLDFAFRGGREEGSRAIARRQGPELFPLVLIAANEAGYRNLVRLVSRAYLETHPGDGRPLAARILDGFADGIICLTGGPHGPIGRALKSDHPQLAEERLLSLKRPVRRPRSMSRSSASPATTARSKPQPSISPTGTICRWSPPTRRSSWRARISTRMTR